jgi:hypothetical protein
LRGGKKEQALARFICVDVEEDGGFRPSQLLIAALQLRRNLRGTGLVWPRMGAYFDGCFQGGVA